MFTVELREREKKKEIETDRSRMREKRKRWRQTDGERERERVRKNRDRQTWREGETFRLEELKAEKREAEKNWKKHPDLDSLI